jgi:AcrR family transcriptional regulator
MSLPASLPAEPASPSTEPTSPSTRDSLLESATRLFAERGVFEVSLAEIVRESGQRNASAIQYHFGTREQLLFEVLAPTVHWLRERRAGLLRAAADAPIDRLRPAVEVIVRPLAELARRGPEQRAWMKIGIEIADAPHRVPDEINSLLAGAGGTEALAVLKPRCPPLPAAVWDTRSAICIAFTSRAATDRARALDAPPSSSPSLSPRQGALGDEPFVQNLIDMFLGALTAPLTAALSGPLGAPEVW